MISIHAPLAGSDIYRVIIVLAPHDFNPRSPCGERHRSYVKLDSSTNFNPRSPCGERLCQRQFKVCNINFNPRSPCGERPFQNGTGVFRVLFQSTLPLRGATGSHNSLHSVSYISIHAPLAGSDDPHGDSLSGVQDFNPRSPCGERQSSSLSFSNLANFNPRSPCGERLLTSLSPNSRSGFQSTLPLRGAT